MEQEQLTGLEPTWAVIELFGHSQIAGKLSTITLGGSVLLRVDVPERVKVTTEWDYNTRPATRLAHEYRTPGYTRLFGVGAIYAINPCSEKKIVVYPGPFVEPRFPFIERQITRDHCE